MRTKLRSKITLLFMTCAVLIAIPAVAALADIVRSDVVANGTDTIVAGGTTTINYHIENNNAGGGSFSTCDASDGSSVTLTINKPAAVTASPGSLTFNSCDDPKPVQFSSNTPGDYNITVSASDTRGNYNVGPAAFTLHVTNPPPPPNTAPTLNLPANPTAEATGPNGAAVSFNATANDTQDGPLNVTCSPASGSTFPLGSTQVNCSATDSGGLTTSGFFAVTVQDTTAPVIANHDDVTAEATGPDGANVSYNSPGTTDAVDSPGTANCTPASGSKFALGDTTVTCNATDAAGNQATPTTFKVTVADTTAPELNLPANITEEATGPNGAAVSFNATASDAVDGNVAVTCDPASGSTFALGTTTVDCTATDAAGNSSSGSFNVLVRDTTAPTLASHDDVSATATSSAGAVVNYTKPSATDAVDSNPTVTCSPAPGATFPIGTTTVSCTAKDASGNESAAKTFKVNVSVSWSGFLQPINTPTNMPTNFKQSVFKMGSTVPVKFQLTGASAGITDGNFYLKYIRTGNGDGIGETEVVATATGSTGTQFRYDATAGQYIFNWSTKGITQAGNYEVRVYTDSNFTNLLGSQSIELKK